ncbi:MAG: DUF2341 domain-containing protein [Candidatus Hadarchaeota archaeon]
MAHWGGNISFSITFGGSGFDRIVAPDARVVDGDWHLVTAVREAGSLKLYIDGELAAEPSDPQVANVSNEGDFVIGASPGYFYRGELDDAMVYDRALSAEEVGWMYYGIEGWLGGWKYRRPVIISNAGSSALVDYQVTLTLDTAALITSGKLRGNGYDIRFALGDGTELPYWIESGMNTSATKVWVKVPSIPPNRVTRIFMYYGNPIVAGKSSGEKVFELFDDFSGAFLDESKWTTRRGAPALDGSKLKLAGGDGKDAIYSNGSWGLGHAFRFRSRPVATDFQDAFSNVDSLGDFTDDSEFVVTFNGAGAKYLRTIRNDNRATTKVPWSLWSPTWSVFEIQRPDSHAAKLLGNDNVTIQNTSNIPLGNLHVGHSSDGATYEVDWSLVRKIGVPEPAASFGSEQNMPMALPLFGWDHFMPVTIASTSQLSEYQVRVNVLYCAGMKQDFSDIRFTLEDGGTLLPYWVENYDSSSANVWVAVPQLQVGETTIYAYYGNQSATTASSGDMTFDFFDDFSGEGLDTGKWVAVGGAPEVNGFELVLFDSSAKERVRTIQQFGPQTAFRARVSQPNADSQHGYASSFVDPSDALETAIFWGATPLYFRTRGLGSETNSVGWKSGYSVFEIKRPSSTEIVFSADDNVLTTHNTEIPSALNLVHQSARGVTTKVDWSLARKHVYPEPTAVVGSGQAVPADPHLVFAAVKDLVENTCTVSGAAALPENTYYWRVRAIDGAGNVGEWSDVWKFTVASDSEPPVSAVENITPHWKSELPFKITARASDDRSGVAGVTLWYRFSPDNLAWGVWKEFGADNDEPYGWNFGAPDGDGHYQFYTIAVDKAGNAESAPEAADAWAGVDTAPPSTSHELSGEEGNADWWSGEVDVVLSAADNLSGVYTTFYQVDGNSWQVYSDSFTISGDGVHSVDYYSVDVAGNEENKKSIEIKIDTLPPETSHELSGVVGNAGWWRSDVTVTLSAADDNSLTPDVSGVDLTEYRVDGGEWATYQAPISIHEDGIHLVEYRSADVAGNRETIKSVEVRIDATPPVSSADKIEPYWQTSMPVEITAAASDGRSGVARVELFYRHSADNRKWDKWASLGAKEAPPRSWRFDAPAGYGFYEVYTAAEDMAGNLENAPEEPDQGFCAVIPAVIDIDPDTLNLDSQGRWITTYIELPQGFGVENIAPNKVALEGGALMEGELSAELHPTEVGDHDNDGVPDLMVKFDRAAVQGLVNVGDNVRLTVIGKWNEIPFRGADSIRVIDPGHGSGGQGNGHGNNGNQGGQGQSQSNPGHGGTPPGQSGNQGQGNAGSQNNQGSGQSNQGGQGSPSAPPEQGNQPSTQGNGNQSQGEGSQNGSNGNGQGNGRGKGD